MVSRRDGRRSSRSTEAGDDTGEDRIGWDHVPHDVLQQQGIRVTQQRFEGALFGEVGGFVMVVEEVLEDQVEFEHAAAALPGEAGAARVC